MTLFLDVVSNDLHLPDRERQQQTARAIGEILPWVLAKYGVSVEHSANSDGARRTQQDSLQQASIQRASIQRASSVQPYWPQRRRDFSPGSRSSRDSQQS